MVHWQSLSSRCHCWYTSYTWLQHATLQRVLQHGRWSEPSITHVIGIPARPVTDGGRDLISTTNSWIQPLYRDNCAIIPHPFSTRFLPASRLTTEPLYISPLLSSLFISILHLCHAHLYPLMTIPDIFFLSPLSNLIKIC